MCHAHRQWSPVLKCVHNKHASAPETLMCFKQQTDSQIQIYFHTIFFWLKIALESTSKLRLMFAFSYFICTVHRHLHQGLKIHCSSPNMSCF